MKRRLVAIALIAVLAGLVGWSVWSRLARRPAAAATVAVPVTVQAAARGSIARTLRYPGTLEPSAVVTVLAKVPGRVERVLVSEGDAVRAGRLLVLIEDDVARLQADAASAALATAQAQFEKARRGVRPEELASAQATLASAQMDLADAETAGGRADRLYAEGAITKTAREEAQSRLRAARTAVENARRGVQMMEQGAGSEEQRMAGSQLAAAQAQYDLAKLNLANTRITAPIGGEVARVLIDEGNLAGTATPLLVIVNESAMVVKAAVPERHYAAFLAGAQAMRAEAVFAALPGRGPLAGRLLSVSPTIEASTRTFTAEVEVADPRGELRSGMYATVTFAVERAGDALLVPAAAFGTRAGARGVFVVDGGVARFRALRTGIEDGEAVEVREGLAAGDLVVVDGNAFLEDGQRVSVGE